MCYMRDIIFDPKKKVVRLKREEPLEKIIRLFRRLGAPATSTLSIFLVAMLVLGYQSFVAKADVAYFYPSTCLGDWQNPELASGGRDTDEGASVDAFTEDNSAILKGSAGRIYCGSFEGSLPEGAIPTDISVGLAFTYKEPAIEVLVNTEAITETGALDPNVTSTSTATSFLEVINEKIDDTSEGVTPEVMGESIEATEVVEEPVTEVIEEVPEVVPEVVPEIIPEATPESETVSWLLWSPAVAFAQEQELLTETETTTVTSTPIIEEIVEEPKEEEAVQEDNPEEKLEEKSEEVSTTSEVQGEILGEATTTATTSEEVVVTGEMAPTSEPEQNDTAEILYTLDGENWISISTINLTDESGVNFHIPSVNVADLSHMQISIQAIGGNKQIPNIYLDSMWLEVSYTLPPPPEPYHEPVPARERVVFRSADFILLDSLDELKDKYQSSDPTVNCAVSPFSQEFDQNTDQERKLEFKVSLPSDQTSPFRIRFGDLPIGMSVSDMGETYPDIFGNTATSSGHSFNFSVSINVEAQIGQSGIVLMYDTASLLGGEARTAQCQFSISVK